MIELDSTAVAELKVQMGDTAAVLRFGPQDSFPPVFATSRMIALMEIAAARVLGPHLGDGEASVGVTVDIKHTAASAIGDQIRAVATLRRVEGNLYHFDIEAFDSAGPIGTGQHTRAIVQAQRLLAGAARRADKKTR